MGLRGKPARVGLGYLTDWVASSKSLARDQGPNGSKVQVSLYPPGSVSIWACHDIDEQARASLCLVFRLATINDSQHLGVCRGVNAGAGAGEDIESLVRAILARS
jgi:hypothetical protein